MVAAERACESPLRIPAASCWLTHDSQATCTVVSVFDGPPKSEARAGHQKVEDQARKCPKPAGTARGYFYADLAFTWRGRTPDGMSRLSLKGVPGTVARLARAGRGLGQRRPGRDGVGRRRLPAFSSIIITGSAPPPTPSLGFGKMGRVGLHRKRPRTQGALARLGAPGAAKKPRPKKVAAPSLIRCCRKCDHSPRRLFFCFLSSSPYKRSCPREI